jgi:hypothetical protein
MKLRLLLVDEDRTVQHKRNWTKLFFTMGPGHKSAQTKEKKKTKLIFRVNKVGQWKLDSVKWIVIIDVHINEIKVPSI